jgi:hypothetical protein
MLDHSIITLTTVLAVAVVHLAQLDQLGLQELRVELEQLVHLELLAELDHLAPQDRADHRVTL